MATQWPLVVARLLVLIPALPGWDQVSIFDGPPVTDDVPVDYLTVGFVDNDTAGSYTQVQDPNGFQYVETGLVRSQLTCTSGDTDMASDRARVFALVDALEAAVRDDRRLGVLSPAGTSELEVEVLSLQTSGGSSIALMFTLHYTTVT
jgi:hypothetical protein